MKLFHNLLKILASITVFFISVTSSAVFADNIAVGLYPWVPRIDQFKTTLTTQWEALHPEDTLTFMTSDEWDGGYNTDPSDAIDIYVFDAINMNYFSSRGWLASLSAQDINDISDFIPYAINGVKNGDSYWGIPQLGCTNILFFDASDTALANATTLTEIKTELNSCLYTSQVPPNRSGLMVDMKGSTTNATLYLDTEHSINNVLPVPQPTTAAGLDTNAIENLQQVLQMASYYNATEDPDALYGRAIWFSQGHGRAVIGFTEAMAAMSQETLDKIAFKVMPLSDNTTSPPFFYSDVIGIFPKEDRTSAELARVKELANLMASTNYMIASTIPQGTSSPLPQYLMPVRTSIFEGMKDKYPLYGTMQTLVKDSNPVLFSMDANSKIWIQNMKTVIKSKIRADYPCGCDFEAGPIASNTTAPATCNALCETHGGWNGQWTTTVPGAMSVCGCNACEISP